MQKIHEPLTYSISEAAKILGVHKCTIWRSITNGYLKSNRFGKGHHRIPKSEIERFLNGTKME